MNRTDALNAALTELQNDSDIEASILFSEDGLVIASSLPHYMDKDHIAAMSAAMLAMAKRSCQELKKGQLEQLMLKGEDGYAIVQSAGDFSALVTITKKESTLGLVFLSMKRTAGKIIEILAT